MARAAWEKPEALRAGGAAGKGEQGMEGRGGSCQVLEETQTDADKASVGRFARRNSEFHPQPHPHQSKDIFNFPWAFT